MGRLTQSGSQCSTCCRTLTHLRRQAEDKHAAALELRRERVAGVPLHVLAAIRQQPLK